MVKYIIKRIAIMPLMLIIISFFLFCIINISPTDPAIALLPSGYTAEQREAIHEEYGFNDPILVQYFNWWKKTIQGDFGISYQSRAPIWKEVVEVRLPVSAGLALISVAITVLIGVPLGVLCAVKQHSWVDVIVNLCAKALGGIPAFVAGVILVLVFSLQLGWFPSFGLKTPLHWVLPVLASAMAPIASMIRQTRSAMLGCINQDYVTTARSKGVPERRVIFSEALRNALLPVITMVGTQIGLLISGSVVVERIFAIPGLGAYIVNAITYKDTPAVMGATMTLSTFFMIIMILVDVTYAIVDPRTRSVLIKKRNKSKKIEMKGATI